MSSVQDPARLLVRTSCSFENEVATVDPQSREVVWLPREAIVIPPNPPSAYVSRTTPSLEGIGSDNEGHEEKKGEDGEPSPSTSR